MSMYNDLIVVAGGSGFVGRALIKKLADLGHTNVLNASRSTGYDLTDPDDCHDAVLGASQVYNLAANVGGIDFIQKNRLACILSSQINTNLLIACRDFKVPKYFFASSACVYPSNDFQIAESYAYPSNPEPGYGQEKLFGEQMCQAFREGGNVETRVARYFTLFGPGDRKPHNHVVAALIQKIITAKLLAHDSIEVWGDGTQTRSFLFGDDCVDGTIRLMNSGVAHPVNLSGVEAVSVNELLDLIEQIAGTRLERRYVPGTVGVKHRVSDNAGCRRALGWEPSTSFQTGLERTYGWWFDALIKEL